ncbi:hypothetical protein J1N35_000762 [Gossypium stocksii]|uniref:Uncharacterized protein n=1 Tax=Gossypium stocksii TaxID=47602 RepID=A0A9D3WHH9_9ROSI|nr:hypothetical protein J1N35_000762 [Gossypium stocksii]
MDEEHPSKTLVCWEETTAKFFDFERLKEERRQQPNFYLKEWQQEILFERPVSRIEGSCQLYGLSVG